MEKFKKGAFILLGISAVFLFFFPQLQEALRSREIQNIKEDNLKKAREAKSAKTDSTVLKKIEAEKKNSLDADIVNDNQNEEVKSE